MFLLSPHFTLFLMMSLGAAIDLSPLFLRSFIGHEALVENGMMDKRSSNPFQSNEKRRRLQFSLKAGPKRPLFVY